MVHVDVEGKDNLGAAASRVDVRRSRGMGGVSKGVQHVREEVG